MFLEVFTEHPELRTFVKSCFEQLVAKQRTKVERKFFVDLGGELEISLEPAEPQASQGAKRKRGEADEEVVADAGASADIKVGSLVVTSAKKEKAKFDDQRGEVFNALQIVATTFTPTTTATTTTTTTITTTTTTTNSNNYCYYDYDYYNNYNYY